MVAQSDQSLIQATTAETLSDGQPLPANESLPYTSVAELSDVQQTLATTSGAQIATVEGTIVLETTTDGGTLIQQPDGQRFLIYSHGEDSPTGDRTTLSIRVEAGETTPREGAEVTAFVRQNGQVVSFKSSYSQGSELLAGATQGEVSPQDGNSYVNLERANTSYTLIRDEATLQLVFRRGHGDVAHPTHLVLNLDLESATLLQPSTQFSRHGREEEFTPPPIPRSQSVSESTLDSIFHNHYYGTGSLAPLADIAGTEVLPGLTVIGDGPETARFIELLERDDMLRVQVAEYTRLQPTVVAIGADSFLGSISANGRNIASSGPGIPSVVALRSNFEVSTFHNEMMEISSPRIATDPFIQTASYLASDMYERTFNRTLPTTASELYDQMMKLEPAVFAAYPQGADAIYASPEVRREFAQQLNENLRSVGALDFPDGTLLFSDDLQLRFIPSA